MENNEHIKDLIVLMESAYKEKRYLDLADYYDEYQIRKGLKMAYEHTYFFDLTEDLSLKIPQPVIDEMELTDEPCLITKPFDDMLSFTKMYEGATVEGLKPNDKEYKKILEMIDAPKDRVLHLKQEWLDEINLKAGDLMLITSFDDSFDIQKFDLSEIEVD